MRKKAISFLLCACMACATFMPSTVSASTGKTLATSTAPALKSANGLTLNKTVTQNGDGTYKISLDAFTTGKVNPVPTDIVLVLDESGSMWKDPLLLGEIYDKSKLIPVYGEQNINQRYLEGGKYFVLSKNVINGPDKEGSTYRELKKDGSGYFFNYTELGGKKKRININVKTSSQDNGKNKFTVYLQRLDALKLSAEQFVDRVYADAVTNNYTGINHRISIVSYSDNATIETGLTEVLTGKETIKSKINDLDASGDTYANKGLNKAKEVFDSKPLSPGEKRNRTVVMFTDGYPGNGSWSNILGTGKSCADEAISIANQLKKIYNAKTFTIGIFKGSNPNDNLNGNSDDMLANRYLNYVSSNFPDAISLNNGGVLSFCK